jgi:hypothetical protein
VKNIPKLLMETKNINVREDKLYTNTVKDGEISPYLLQTVIEEMVK